MLNFGTGKMFRDYGRLSACFKPLCLILCLTIIAATSFGQAAGRIITGQVTDDRGEPVVGASVMEKNGNAGTMTDTKGNFEISVSGNTVILTISFKGYATVELNTEGKAVLDVKLSTESTSLNEVVVVGYGTKTKGNLTGAVSSVSARELEKSPAANLTNSIAGQVPGLIVNTRSGEPGNDDASVFIRGKGTLGDQSPLIVIDGIPDRAGGFARLNPADIASFTVLKDATAAIYGARAANGVILITTKRGSSGKSSLSFSVNQAFTQPTRKPSLLNAYEYAVAEREYYTLPGAGTGRTLTDEDLQKYKDGSSPLTHPNTNWWDAIMKDWTLQQNYTLTLSGGTDK
ncbi:MAG: SusC/RagA family TonB-linked outer membrane protein, partial [Chitinophagaceae bacterium]